MEFNKNEAIKTEYRNYESSTGGRIAIYTYKCSNSDCNNTIRVQSNGKQHKGKCRKCCLKKRPYEFLLPQLAQLSKIKGILEPIISYEELLNLIKNPFCFYCDIKVKYSEYTKDKKGNDTSRAYNLDRKDNNKGYTNNNLVVCCWNCNRLKSNMYTYEEFLKLSPILKEITKERQLNN